MIEIPDFLIIDEGELIMHNIHLLIGVFIISIILGYVCWKLELL